MPETGLILSEAQQFRDLSRDILGRGIALRYRARGKSMYPAIRDGDLLEVRPAGLADIHVGSVIFFEGAGGSLFAHRLVYRKRAMGAYTLVAKGDAVADADRPFGAEQLIGRVVRVARGDRVYRLDGPWGAAVGWLLAQRSLWGPRLRSVLRGIRVGSSRSR